MTYHYQADKNKAKDNLSKVAKNLKTTNTKNIRTLNTNNLSILRPLDTKTKPIYRGILEGLKITHINHYNSVKIHQNRNMDFSLDKPNKRLNLKNALKHSLQHIRKKVVLGVSKFNRFCGVQRRKLKKQAKGVFTNRKGGFYYWN